MTSIFLNFFSTIFVFIFAHRVFTAILGVLLGFLIYQAIVNPAALGDLIAKILKMINSADIKSFFSNTVETVVK